jgi:hypothetical protein
MSIKCPICRKKILCGRNHVFICTHASMPLGVVFSPDRRRYEWNCTSLSSLGRDNYLPIVTFEIHEEFKKDISPIIFE